MRALTSSIDDELCFGKTLKEMEDSILGEPLSEVTSTYILVLLTSYFLHVTSYLLVLLTCYFLHVTSYLLLITSR